MRWEPDPWGATRRQWPRPWIRECVKCDHEFLLETHWMGGWYSHILYLCSTCCPTFADADAMYRLATRVHRTDLKAVA